MPERWQLIRVRKPGGLILPGFNIQWTGGPICWFMPRSRQWKLRCRLRFYVLSDHRWQITRKIHEALRELNADLQPLPEQPKVRKVFRPMFTLEMNGHPNGDWVYEWLLWGIEWNPQESWWPKRHRRRAIT